MLRMPLGCCGADERDGADPAPACGRCSPPSLPLPACLPAVLSCPVLSCPVSCLPPEMARRKLLEDSPIPSTNEEPVLFDTSEIPWWAWVRRFHLPEVREERAEDPHARMWMACVCFLCVGGEGEEGCMQAVGRGQGRQAGVYRHTCQLEACKTSSQGARDAGGGGGRHLNVVSNSRQQHAHFCVISALGSATPKHGLTSMPRCPSALAGVSPPFPTTG